MLTEKKRTFLKATTIASLMGIEPKVGQYGVEIELEGRRLPKVIRGWNSHAEGSLRGEAIEYVTAGAYSAKDLAVALDFLTATFNANQTQAEPSYRAGVHIHYNVNSRTVDSVLRSIVLWIILEPIFLKLCGKERDGNLFCMSTYDTGDVHLWFRRLFKGAESGMIAGIHRYFARGKYSALNTDTLNTIGTLECRAFPSTVDKDTILGWADLLDRILKDTPLHPQEMIECANKDPLAFLIMIFGKEMKLPEDCISLLGFGVEHAFLMANTYTEYMGEDL